MKNNRRPACRIWVAGQPRSSGARSARPGQGYREAIAVAATAACSAPLRSPRIDIEVWFGAPYFDRADVDNVLKPILDAMKGIVFLDDAQVRSVKATALPSNDAWRISGWSSEEIVGRLTRGETAEFLIDVFEGLELEGPAV